MLSRDESHDASFGEDGAYLATLFMREFTAEFYEGTRELDGRELPCEKIRVTPRAGGKSLVLTGNKSARPQEGPWWMGNVAKTYPDTAFAAALKRCGGHLKDRVVFVSESDKDMVSVIMTALRKACDSPETTMWHQLLQDLNGSPAMGILNLRTNSAMKSLVASSKNLHRLPTRQNVIEALHDAWFRTFDGLNDVVQAMDINSNSHALKDRIKLILNSVQIEDPPNLVSPIKGLLEELEEELKGGSVGTRRGFGKGVKLGQAIRYSYLNMHTLTHQVWGDMLGFALTDADDGDKEAWYIISTLKNAEVVRESARARIAVLEGGPEPMSRESVKQLETLKAQFDQAKLTIKATLARITSYRKEYPDHNYAMVTPSGRLTSQGVIAAREAIPQWIRDALDKAEVVQA